MIEEKDLRHEYEPGYLKHPMITEPLCKVCGKSKRSWAHNPKEE